MLQTREVSGIWNWCTCILRSWNAGPVLKPSQASGLQLLGGFCVTELDPLQGLGFWVWGFGSWGVGLGFRVWGPGFRTKADAANKRNLGNMELVYMHTSVLECRTFIEAFTSFGILCACIVLFGDLEPLQASGLWNVFECIVLFGWSSALLHGPGQNQRTAASFFLTAKRRFFFLFAPALLCNCCQRNTCFVRQRLAQVRG